MAGWWEPVRDYCERTGPEPWAEPLNAASNAAFVVAALLLLRRGRAPDGTADGFAWLVGLIGIGSALFHTLAVRWAMLADVIPIAVFIHAYVFLALRRFLGLGAPAALAGTLAFALAAAVVEPVLSGLAGRPLGPLSNNSIDYLPAALALFGVGAASLRFGGREGGALIGLGILFLVSLLARTLDSALCPVLPFGTHWLWHLLNAGLLYGLVRAARRAGPAARHSRPDGPAARHSRPDGPAA
ncbi:ceramidase [Methylobacterium terrae]|uniref:ceramidase n=1 Tax=Methylobacterium terrae TaxID=2202827 RepID=UPI001FE0D9B0|nr:ceramidase [Methylobacterium terrae]